MKPEAMPLSLGGADTYIAHVLRKPFIEPSAPVLGREPPSGREWIHEVKHDG